MPLPRQQRHDRLEDPRLAVDLLVGARVGAPVLTTYSLGASAWSCRGRRPGRRRPSGWSSRRSSSTMWSEVTVMHGHLRCRAPARLSPTTGMASGGTILRAPATYSAGTPSTISTMAEKSRTSRVRGGMPVRSMVNAIRGFLRSAATFAEPHDSSNEARFAGPPEPDGDDARVAIEANIGHPGGDIRKQQLLGEQLGEGVGNGLARPSLASPSICGGDTRGRRSRQRSLDIGAGVRPVTSHGGRCDLSGQGILIRSMRMCRPSLRRDGCCVDSARCVPPAVRAAGATDRTPSRGSPRPRSSSWRRAPRCCSRTRSRYARRRARGEGGRGLDDRRGTGRRSGRHRR